MRNILTTFRNGVDRIGGGLVGRARRDRKGVAALEFALVFPVMIALYLSCVDISQILTASRKASNVASAVGDLVAQALQIDTTEVQNIFDAGEAMLEPLPTDSLTMVITSVLVDADGNTEVRWSDAHNTAPRPEGSSMNLPDGIAEPNSTVIVSEVTYSYTSVVSELVSHDGVNLQDTFYLRPRRTVEIARVP